MVGDLHLPGMSLDGDRFLEVIHMHAACKNIKDGCKDEMKSQKRQNGKKNKEGSQRTTKFLGKQRKRCSGRSRLLTVERLSKT